jgi:hypothetical protein
MRTLFLKKTIAIAICLLISASTFAENNTAQDEQPPDATPTELTYKNGVWQDNQKITRSQVRSLLSGTDALKLYDSGHTLFVVGQVIACPSAALFGYDLGTRLAGGEGNAIVLGVGIVGTAVGLALSFSGESKMKSSIKLYNKQSGKAAAYQIDYGFVSSGVGICLRF